MTEPIPYATPIRGSNHDTIYTVLLGVLAFIILIGVIEMGFFAHRPGQTPEIVWVFKLVFSIDLAFLLFVTAVLLIRIAMPARRKWVTLALNIVMLFLFPFGTALAIYGLWKVDKNVPDQLLT